MMMTDCWRRRVRRLAVAVRAGVVGGRGGRNVAQAVAAAVAAVGVAVVAAAVDDGRHEVVEHGRLHELTAQGQRT